MKSNASLGHAAANSHPHTTYCCIAESTAQDVQNRAKTGFFCKKKEPFRGGIIIIYSTSKVKSFFLFSETFSGMAAISAEKKIGHLPFLRQKSDSARSGEGQGKVNKTGGGQGQSAQNRWEHTVYNNVRHVLQRRHKSFLTVRIYFSSSLFIISGPCSTKIPAAAAVFSVKCETPGSAFRLS